MDNKITLSILAQMLATRTGRSRKECDDLLRSFFQAISTSLAAGETVKVRGFGTFKISPVDARMSVDISSGEDFEIPAHNKIVFLPAKELAGAVNAPFEMFETIELSDNLTDMELREAEATGSPQQSDDEATVAYDESVEPEAEVAVSPVGQAAVQLPEKEEESLPVADVATEDAAEELEMPEDKPSEEYTEDEEYDESPEPAARSRFGHGFVWGMVVAILLLVAGVGVAYWLNEDFAGHVDQMTGRVSAPAAVPAKDAVIERDASAAGNLAADAEVLGDIEAGVDGVQEEVVPETKDTQDENPVPTKPSDAVVYDTVRPNTGLGNMARRHYGNFHFWPYIYKENEKVLGHPDRITPGTRVVIPPLSKYGVDPKNPADLAHAKQLDAQIYARFKSARPK